MIGLVLEGSSDRAVKEIFKKIDVAVPKVRLMNGYDPRKAVSFSRYLLKDGCEKVIVLKDTHCADPDQVKQTVRAQLIEKGLDEELGGKVKVCAVASAIESWMLADPEAIGDYLGAQVEETSEPERIHKPEETLNEHFRKHKAFPRQYYKGGTDPEEIARRLDVGRVRMKCPHYREFEQAIQDP